MLIGEGWSSRLIPSSIAIVSYIRIGKRSSQNECCEDVGVWRQDHCCHGSCGVFGCAEFEFLCVHISARTGGLFLSWFGSDWRRLDRVFDDLEVDCGYRPAEGSGFGHAGCMPCWG